MYVDPNRNQQASNLRWILPYCKPDLSRVLGAVLLFIVNDTMALIIPLITGVIVDQVITGGHADMLTRLCLIMIVFTLIRVDGREQTVAVYPSAGKLTGRYPEDYR